MAAKLTHVVDACAVIAYLKAEDGHENFAGILRDERNVLAMHALNFCEVYIDYLRSDGLQAAEEAAGHIVNMLAIDNRLDENFMKRVARWRVDHRLHLPDAVAAATAEEHACPLVTADHKDFEVVEQSRALEIVWIR